MDAYAQALNAYTAKQQEVYGLAALARTNPAPENQKDFRKAFAELHRLYDMVKLYANDNPLPAYPSPEE